MASPNTLRLRQIKPPAARWVVQGTTFVSREARARQAEWLADDAAKRKGRPKYKAKHLMVIEDLARSDRRAKKAFRGRRASWKAGADRIVERMFRGLAALWSGS